jgi:diguanylate cyclase
MDSSQQNDQLKAEWELAQQAMKKMEMLYVSPIPEHYFLWYNYFARSNPQLLEEINNRIEKELPFDDAFLHFLQKSHGASMEAQLRQAEKEAEHTEKLGHTQDVLSDALSIITSIISDAHSQNDAIQVKIDNIISNKDSHDISSILEAMVAVAKEMKRSGTGLRNKLDESRREVEKLEQRLNEISVEAEKDFLTNVYNRKSLDKYLHQRMQEAREQRTALSLLAIDIDHFKRFNDTFGHLIGDEVLKMTAKLLVESVKGKDIVARFGGEEFVVILPDTSIGGANSVAEIIRQSIAKKELKNRKTGESYGSISVSIGVALFRPESDSAESWFARADEALYRSKKAGRNCVTQENLSEPR